eukprot:CAMPEP_0185040702 /NCGR_PEP_ID=MMETSP1103-20130426/39067_1 /TAXON_ID=36769 /ORGANISM="Paraphysomonas bandaiensis, Strain Caron Lab Isolate" /LENGTH=1763 /DNA_ID=CAMNT_0027580099 /DNA_START=66 /DNA_END=5357 /DNA_ORIENTATION=+
MNLWLHYIGLERQSDAVYKMFCEAVVEVFYPVFEKVDSFSGSKDVSDISMLCKYFGSWSRQREACAVFNLHDYVLVLDALGLCSTKFRNPKELHTLKCETDLRLIDISDVQQLLTTTFENYTSKSTPLSSGENDVKNHPFVEAVRDMVLHSSKCTENASKSDASGSVSSFKQLIMNIRTLIREGLIEESRLVAILHNAAQVDALDKSSVTFRPPGMTKRIGLNGFRRFCAAFGYCVNDECAKQIFSNIEELKKALFNKMSQSTSISSNEKTEQGSANVDDLLELLLLPIESNSAGSKETRINIESKSDDASHQPDPRSVGDKRYITVTQFVIALSRVLLPSDFRKNLLDLEAASAPRQRRIRRKKRQRAVEQGHVGGKKILEPPSAVLKLQSTYRGWRTRKQRKRERIAAVEIQRVSRGRLNRIKYKEDLNRMKICIQQEKERAKRLRRIRNQEKELALLRHLPVQNFLEFERLRSGSSAKIIQKCWRKRRLMLAAREKKKLQTSKDPKENERKRSGEADETEAKISQLQAEMLEHFNAITSRRIPVLELDDCENSLAAPDALSLVQLMDRVKDEAKKKQIEKDNLYRQQYEIDYTHPGAKPSRGVAGSNMEGRSNPRRKFQEYFQSKQQAAVLLDEYLTSQSQWKENQSVRMESLSRSKRLLDHLTGRKKPLLSLEDARQAINGSMAGIKSSRETRQHGNLHENTEMKKDRGTYEASVRDILCDIPPFDNKHDRSENSIHSAIGGHLKTVKAIREKSNWGAIAYSSMLCGAMHHPVHDANDRFRATGLGLDTALMNVRDLDYSLHDDKKLLEGQSGKKDKPNKYARINPLQASKQEVYERESLLWVAYATQQRQGGPKEDRGDQPGVGTNTLDNVSRDITFTRENREEVLLSMAELKANELLGEVKGEELLNALAKKSMISPEKRHAQIMELCEQAVQLRDRLAELLRVRALASVDLQKRRHALRAGKFAKAKSEEEIRDLAATRIQAICRGRRGREFVKHMKAEQRVMGALRLLVAELTQPELKGKAPMLQLERALVGKFAQLAPALVPSAPVSERSEKASLVSTEPASTSDMLQGAKASELFSSSKLSISRPALPGTPYGSSKPKELIQAPSPGGAGVLHTPRSDMEVFTALRQQQGNDPVSQKHLFSSPRPPGSPSSKAQTPRSPTHRIAGQSPRTTGIASNQQPPPQVSSRQMDEASTKIQRMFRRRSMGRIGNVRSEQYSSPTRGNKSPTAKSDRIHQGGIVSSAELDQLSPMSDMKMRIPGLGNTDGYISSPSMSHSETHEAMMWRPRSQSPEQLKSTLGGTANVLYSFPEEESTAGEYMEQVLAQCAKVPSNRSLAAMRSTEEKATAGETVIEISGLLDVGLKSSITETFDKNTACHLLQQLCLVYGPAPMRRWLQHFYDSILLKDGIEPLRGDIVPIEYVATMLGELAIEAGLLNSAIARTGGPEETAGKDMYCQFCMLIKLVAAGSGRGEDAKGGGMVPLRTLQMLMEDEWLKAVPASGIRLYKLLATCRYKSMHQSIQRGMNAADYIEELLMRPTPVRGLDHGDWIGPTAFFSLLSRLGINEIDPSESSALLSMCAWGSVDDTGSNRPTYDNREPRTTVAELKAWLGCLGSYRDLQKKLQVYMRALPRCMDPIKSLSGEDRVRPHTSGGSRSRHSAPVSFSVFVAAMEDGEAPLCHSEAIALGHLLVREKPTHSVNRPVKVDKRFRGKQSIGESVSTLGSVDDSQISADESAPVDTSLLDKIGSGQFVSAAL